MLYSNDRIGASSFLNSVQASECYPDSKDITAILLLFTIPPSPLQFSDESGSPDLSSNFCSTVLCYLRRHISK